jgi:hypothetical protein
MNVHKNTQYAYLGECALLVTLLLTVFRVELLSSSIVAQPLPSIKILSDTNIVSQERLLKKKITIATFADRPSLKIENLPVKNTQESRIIR